VVSRYESDGAGTGANSAAADGTHSAAADSDAVSAEPGPGATDAAADPGATDPEPELSGTSTTADPGTTTVATDARTFDVLRSFMTEAISVVSPDAIITASLGPPDGLLGHGPQAGGSAFLHAHPEDLPELITLLHEIGSSSPGDSARWTGRIGHADGNWRRCEMLAVRMAPDAGVEGIVVRVREVSDAAEQPGTAGFDPSLVIESLADMAPVPIMMLGPLGVIHYANAAALRLFNTDLSSGRKKIEDLAHPVSAEELRAVLTELESTPGRRSVTIELRERRQYEQPRVVRADIDARGAANDVSVMCVSLEDLTTQRQRERELLDQASKDPLTGLANRAEILRLIDIGLQDRPEEVVVAFCDLDGFKVVNDTYGHDVGDELLVTTANCLADFSRKGDAIGRVGGDEFVFVLRSFDDAAAASFAARVVSSIEQSLASKDPPLVSASVGLARGRQGDTARDLLHRADRAMYASKRARRVGGTADVI
jgi:diguanylate cyclase (GGDEF)-like protein